VTGETSEASFVTDPYRPPVGETASDNPPFVVKGSEEFPARQGGLSCVTCRKTVKTHI
jgi:hypothetical protein